MSKQLDPVSGPLSRDELRALASAPFGKATEVIRQHDPLFGRKEGEKIKWKVTYTAQIKGMAMVEAASREEAEKEADEVPISSIAWDEWDIADSDIDDWEIEPQP